MISREDAQRFFSQEKVWVWGTGYDMDVNNAIEGEPCLVNRPGEGYWIDNFTPYANFSLTDPRPKREFEDGAMYAITTIPGGEKLAVTYIKRYDYFCHRNVELHRNYIQIGKKLPKELWEE